MTNRQVELVAEERGVEDVESLKPQEKKDFRQGKKRLQMPDLLSSNGKCCTILLKKLHDSQTQKHQL